MPQLKQVYVINRFKPEQNGSNRIINSFRCNNGQSVEIAFPVHSTYYGTGKTTGVYNCSSIMDPSVTQDELYTRVGERVLDHLFRSQNALFLAYGITGSGKTFTTVGNARNEGLLQHCCEKLLNMVFQKSTVYNQFVVRFSMAAAYDELGVDFLGARATTKGIYSGHQTLHFSEKEITSYSDFLSILLQCQKNQHDYEIRENKKSSDCHTFYTLHLYQRRYQQETPLSLLRFVDLAGCEDVQIGRSGKSPKRSTHSLTFLFDCIQQAYQSSTPASHTLLTSLLKDHLDVSPGYITVIHCISNQYTMLEDTIDAFERLQVISKLLTGPTSKIPTAVIPLCSKCTQYREQLEESIRDQVICEIFSRRKGLHANRSNSHRLHESVDQFLHSIQGTQDNTEVNQIIQAYDQENRDLLKELAEQKKRVQELTEKLEDKEAQIVQLNNIISIQKKSQPWNKNSSSNQSSVSPHTSPMFQPKHVRSSPLSSPGVSPKSVPNGLPSLDTRGCPQKGSSAGSPRGLPQRVLPGLSVESRESPQRVLPGLSGGSPRELPQGNLPGLSGGSPRELPQRVLPGLSGGSPRELPQGTLPGLSGGSPRESPQRTLPGLSGSPGGSPRALPKRTLPGSSGSPGSPGSPSTNPVPQPRRGTDKHLQTNPPGYQLDVLYPTLDGTLRSSTIKKSYTSTHSTRPPPIAIPSSSPKVTPSHGSPTAIPPKSPPPIPPSVYQASLKKSNPNSPSRFYVIDPVNLDSSVNGSLPFEGQDTLRSTLPIKKTGTVKSPEVGIAHASDSDDVEFLMDNISIDDLDLDDMELDQDPVFQKLNKLIRPSLLNSVMKDKM